MTPLLLLLLSTLALANIEVSISGDLFGDDTAPEIFADVTGKDRAVITDQERDTFRIYDSNLKYCVYKYFGKYPDDVYVRRGTPWGDLYQRYGWREVTRTIHPIDATVAKVDTKQQLVGNNVYINDNDTPGRATLKLDKTYEDRVASSWTKSRGYIAGAEMSTKITIKVVEIGTSAHFDISETWGQGYEHSVATSMTDGAQLEFEVAPHSRVYGTSVITKSFAKVRVEYETTLEGQVAVNYATPYRGHHFHVFGINNIMSNCGLPLMIPSSEVITMDMITGVKLQVKDKPIHMSTMLMSAMPLSKVYL